MANPFTITPANPLQALMMGQQGFNQAREMGKSSARDEAAQLFAGGDRQGALARLLQIGDMQGAATIANLGNNERDFAFRQQEAQRAQQNADRSYGLQEKQLGITAANTAATRDLARQQFEFQKEQGNRPDIQLIDDGSGQKVPVLIDRKAGAVRPLPVPGGNAQPNNPFLTGGPMKDDEAKAALYANRMLQAERIFREPSVVSAGQSAFEAGKAKLPGAGTYYNPNSVEYQKFDQARRDFINAVLRRESGAVISDQEFANAERQYFPRPGDSPEVLKQKQQNRIEAIKGIGAAGGRGYRPSYSFDSQGNIVDRGQPQQAQEPSGTPQIGEVRQGYRYKGGDPANPDSWAKL